MTHMETMNALKQAACNKGIPLTHIGVAMGKSRQYVHTILTKHATPQCDTMARMLDVCGYGLYCIPYEHAPKDALQITATDTDA